MPSPEPVNRLSSALSMHMLVIAPSWALNSCRRRRWRMSNMHSLPFLLPEMRSDRPGAYTSDVEYDSGWHWKAV